MTTQREKDKQAYYNSQCAYGVGCGACEYCELTYGIPEDEAAQLEEEEGRAASVFADGAAYARKELLQRLIAECSDLSTLVWLSYHLKELEGAK